MNPLHLDILSQPTDSTCGPTCLHAVYRYFGEEVPLEEVILEVGELEQGGTLAVLLGSHALRRGYDAKIFTYNLHVFDPTWFNREGLSLEERLLAQKRAKNSPRLRTATDAYVEFLRLGGQIRMEVLTVELIRRYLKRNVPILTGLSATFLYGESREYFAKVPIAGRSSIPDDVKGVPCGHFVVLCGYEPERRTVLVADPLESNPIARDRRYAVDIDRAFSAIMLGIVTYDANLLIIRPRRRQGESRHARTDRQ